MKIQGNSIFKEDEKIVQVMSFLEEGNMEWKLVTCIEGVVFDAKMVRMQHQTYEISFEISSDLFKRFQIECFFEEPFLMVSKDGIKLLLKHTDVRSFKQTLSKTKPVAASIIINAFRGDWDDQLWMNAKQAVMLRTNKDNSVNVYESGITFDLTTDIDQNSTWKNGLKLDVDSRTFLFYQIQTNKNYMYVLKSQKPLEHKKFLAVMNAVRAAYALVTGFYMGDDAFFVALATKNKISFRYENLDETINGECPLIDGKHYNADDRALKLSSNIFENVVNLLYNNESLQRACILLTQAGAIKGVPKGSLASVALETITGYLQKRKAEQTLKLIENKETASQLKYELEKGLTKIKGQVDKSIYECLKSKLGKINERPNSSKLEDPFCDLDITLTEDEKFCLRCRNMLLHGSLPKPKGDFYEQLSQEELLRMVSNRLMMLCGMLLLKKAKYNGKVIDRGLTEVIKRRYILNGHYSKIKGYGNIHRTI